MLVLSKPILIVIRNCCALAKSGSKANGSTEDKA